MLKFHLYETKLDAKPIPHGPCTLDTTILDLIVENVPLVLVGEFSEIINGLEIGSSLSLNENEINEFLYDGIFYGLDYDEATDAQVRAIEEFQCKVEIHFNHHGVVNYINHRSIVVTRIE